MAIAATCIFYMQYVYTIIIGVTLMQLVGLAHGIDHNTCLDQIYEAQKMEGNLGLHNGFVKVQ
jgi:hypothetical protein